MIDLASIKDVLLSVHYSDSKWTAAGIQQTTYVYLVPHTIFGWGWRSTQNDLEERNSQETNIPSKSLDTVKNLYDVFIQESIQGRYTVMQCSLYLDYLITIQHL